LYTGITTDLKRRIQEHNKSELGAKYTRAKRPVRLVYIKEFPENNVSGISARSEASKEEVRIKNLTRSEKIELIKNARKEHLAKLRIKKKAGRVEYLNDKENARAVIMLDLERMNRHYNFKYNRVAIRDTKTRWGSCSKAGNLNFNYNLLKLSKEEREYVIVHELCHLEEMNHSKNFWGLVARVVPDYKQYRSQLKSKGSML